MKTIREIYFESLKKGYHNGDLKYLLEHLTGFSSAELSLNFSKPFLQEKKLIKYLHRLSQHEPVQYIIETAYFDNLALFVNHHVLIPRPETEEMVLLATKIILDNQYLSFVDVGTGSGAIALALKKRHPQASVYASDLSKKALKVAQKNAAKHDLAINFTFGDALKPFIQEKLTFDLIIANPPYIHEEEILDLTVLEYEPHQALFSKTLKVYRKIFTQAPQVLNPGGKLILEINPYDVAELKKLIFKKMPGYKPKFLKDLSGRLRFIIIER